MDKSYLLSRAIITYIIHFKPINTFFMKKVIVFRVENVLVKDFNKIESLERAVAIETNKLKRNVGLDVLEKELKKKYYSVMIWVIWRVVNCGESKWKD